MTIHETQDLIQAVLRCDKSDVIARLNARLKDCRASHQQFYSAIIMFGQRLDFSSEQWLDFLIKLPHWRLLAEKSIVNRLSPNQKKILEREIRKEL